MLKLANTLPKLRAAGGRNDCWKKGENYLQGLDALSGSFFLKAIFVHAGPAEQIQSSFSPERLHRWLQLYSIPLQKSGGCKSVITAAVRTCHLPLERDLHGVVTHQLNHF